MEDAANDAVSAVCAMMCPMNARVVPVTPAFAAPYRGRWPALACLVAFFIVMHLSLMVASRPCAAATPSAAVHDTESCARPLARACTVVEQAVEPVPLMPVALVVLLALGIVTLGFRAVALPAGDWLWPPQQRRALLQVYLR